MPPETEPTEEITTPIVPIPPETEAWHVPVLRQLVVALGILAVVFGSTYAGTLASLRNQKADVTSDVRVEATLADVSQAEPMLSKYFNDVVLTAKSAFVFDVQKGKVLFNKNGDEELPLASVTKLMTALVAYELLETGATVPISVDAIRESGDSGFTDGETFSARDLIDLVLIESSNDGARALSSAAGNALIETNDPNSVFIEAMNLKAEEIGLTRTHFSNATGLDLSSTEAGAYGSARDMAFLMEYIVTKYPDLVALTSTELTKIDNKEGDYHLVKNTNEAVSEIPGLIASKTGYTALAGGNLVIAFEAGLNHVIVVAVLGSTEEGRFEDVVLLSERARDYVAGK